MAVVVVDQLEVVEIDQQHAEAVAMPLGTADFVGGQLPEHALIEQVGEGVAGGVVLQIARVFVDRLDRTDHVEQGGQHAFDDQIAGFIFQHAGLHTNTDDAADFGFIDKERLDPQRHFVVAQHHGRRLRVGNVMVNGKQAPFGKIIGFVQRVADVLLHALTRFEGRRAVPEHFQIEHFLVDLENGKQGMRRQDGVDVDQQTADVVAPVAHHLGGDDEFFQQADLESENVLVHRDVTQFRQQVAQGGIDAVQFDKPEITLGHRQGFQIGNGINLFEFFLQLLHALLDPPANPPHRCTGEETGNRQQQGKRPQQFLARLGQQAGILLTHFDCPQGRPLLHVVVAFEAAPIGHQRIDMARFAIAVDALRHPAGQHLAQGVIQRRLGDDAVQLLHRGAAVDLHLHAVVAPGIGDIAQKIVCLAAAPALAHQLVHGRKSDAGSRFGCPRSVVAHDVVEHPIERPVSTAKKKRGYDSRSGQDETMDAHHVSPRGGNYHTLVSERP